MWVTMLGVLHHGSDACPKFKSRFDVPRPSIFSMSPLRPILTWRVCPCPGQLLAMPGDPHGCKGTVGRMKPCPEGTAQPHRSL